jgi:negative regulator of replication initiation
MKIIDIEDDVLAALEKQVRGFNDTPSAVIRRLLEQAARPETGMKKEPAIQTNNHTTNPFTPLVTSPAYLMANAGGRYLQILAFLRKLHGDQEFARLETIRFGGRVYFARIDGVCLVHLVQCRQAKNHHRCPSTVQISSDCRGRRRWDIAGLRHYKVPPV